MELGFNNNTKNYSLYKYLNKYLLHSVLINMDILILMDNVLPYEPISTQTYVMVYCDRHF